MAEDITTNVEGVIKPFTEMVKAMVENSKAIMTDTAKELGAFLESAQEKGFTAEGIEAGINFITQNLTATTDGSVEFDQLTRVDRGEGDVIEISVAPSVGGFSLGGFTFRQLADQRIEAANRIRLAENFVMGSNFKDWLVERAGAGNIPQIIQSLQDIIQRRENGDDEEPTP